MDGHGVDIGVFPISAIGFDPGAVNFNASGTFDPFLKVVVVERLTHTGIAHTVVSAAPPAVAAGLAEGVAFGACKEDVVDAIGACGVAETRVGGGDVIHHVGDGLVAVEAVAPGEGGIGPVDGHDGLVLTFAHPVEDVAGSDSGLNGHFRSNFRLADGMDGHGVDIGVFPISAIGFDPGAVNFNASGTFDPFLKVVVVERLTHTGIAHTVVSAAPPAVAAGLAEGVAFGACKEDVVDAIGACGVAETRVGGGDVIHHVGDGLVAVEAVAPGEGGIGPVDGHDGLVLTFTHPVEDVAGSDSSLNGNRFGHIGVEFNLQVVDAKVVVARGIPSVIGVCAHPKEGEACVVGDGGAVLAESYRVVMQHATVLQEGDKRSEIGSVADNISHNKGGTATSVGTGAVVHGEESLRQGMVKFRKDGITACAVVGMILHITSVGTVVVAIHSEAQEGITWSDASPIVGCGGLTDAAKEGACICGSVIGCSEATVA